SWLLNCELEYARAQFGAIIASQNPRQHQAVLLAEKVGEPENPLWGKPRSVTVLKKGPQIAEALAPLLENAKEIHLIDPHFDPRKKRFRKVLLCLLEKLSLSKSFTVHMNDKFADAKGYQERWREHLGEKISSEITLNFKCWQAPEHSGLLHNRYLLTNLGVILMGNSLDEKESQNATDDFALLGKERHSDLWDWFIHQTHKDLKLVAEPASITGTR
ncbi:MAG: hypothetical protein CMH56_09180, partial [Myxococcales bacterium]|nr:hypothetical protein [Myxococcales bacterium]